MIYETYVKAYLLPHNVTMQVAADNIIRREDAICNEADFSDN